MHKAIVLLSFPEATNFLQHLGFFSAKNIMDGVTVSATRL